jgi:hypothetical protein
MSQTAAGRYANLVSQRYVFLERARDCARVTIPTIMPPAGHGPTTKYPTPFQSMGARGLNNLASKLVLALLPPNSPFFRLVIDDFALEKITGQPGMRGEVDKALNKIERAVQTAVEANAVRTTAFEAFKQLINSGNVLCYLPPEGGMRAFRLDSYVVHRDPSGNVLEIVTEEDISPSVLPNVIRKVIRARKLAGNDGDKDGDESTEKTIKLYTWVRRTDKHWAVHQEVEGEVIPKSKGTYPLDKSPWMPLRWTKIDGEDYGRGLVEEYLGDLRSLEGLSQAIVEGSAAAAKMLFLVKPNGNTRIDTISKAPSGAVRAGNAEDVTVLQLNKHADFSVAQQTMQQIEERLSQAFMLAQSATRQAERVTAEEIRLMAGELEDSLGGVYSLMSQEFQLPLVNRLMHQMERQGKLPALPPGMIKPAITTGLEALGRGNDMTKLQRLLQNLEPLGPEQIAQRLNVGEYIKRVGTADGIEMDGLIYSDDQVQQNQQQAQMMEMVKQLGPQALNQAGGITQSLIDQHTKLNGQAAPQAGNG